MGVFDTITKIQYESTVGGLPGWAYLLIFIVSLIYFTLNIYDSTDKSDSVKVPMPIAVLFGLIPALFVTLFVYLFNRFRKGMFNARTKFYKKQGMNNSTARSTALQTQQFINLGSRIQR